MTVVGSAIIAIGAVLLALYLKPQQKEIAALLTVSATALLFFFSVREAGEAISVIRETAAESTFSGEAETIVKALGIAAVAQITADICREAGEPAVAGQVELFGKVEILLLSLPLAARLLTLARGLLS